MPCYNAQPVNAAELWLPVWAVILQTAVAAVVHDERHIQDEAATKVQAAFRGHQARKHVAEMREATNAVPS